MIKASLKQALQHFGYEIKKLGPQPERNPA